MDEAWEALLAENSQFAMKLSRRARDEGDVNPRIWNDHASILLRCGQAEEAEEAFRTAIQLAPTYAEARANLARLLFDAGRVESAARHQRRVVRYADTAKARTLLAEYEAEAPPADATDVDGGAGCEFTELTRRIDWEEVGETLLHMGVARLSEILTESQCEVLAGMFTDDELFEHEVLKDNAGEGRVHYRFFQQPLPEIVQRLREEFYARAAVVVNGWQQMLRNKPYPATLECFLALCRKQGQYRTTPILLRYPAGGFNGLHCDVAGRVHFPLQLAITLGPGNSLDAGGGEFVLVDERPGKKRRRHEIGTGVGDGVLFCTRNRLAKVGGIYGLQRVVHGVTEVKRERYALGIPFHDHG